MLFREVLILMGAGILALVGGIQAQMMLWPLKPAIVNAWIWVAFLALALGGTLASLVSEVVRWGRAADRNRRFLRHQAWTVGGSAGISLVILALARLDGSLRARPAYFLGFAGAVGVVYYLLQPLFDLSQWVQDKLENRAEVPPAGPLPPLSRDRLAAIEQSISRLSQNIRNERDGLLFRFETFEAQLAHHSLRLRQVDRKLRTRIWEVENDLLATQEASAEERGVVQVQIEAASRAARYRIKQVAADVQALLEHATDPAAPATLRVAAGDGGLVVVNGEAGSRATIHVAAPVTVAPAPPTNPFRVAFPCFYKGQFVRIKPAAQHDRVGWIAPAYSQGIGLVYRLGAAGQTGTLAHHDDLEAVPADVLCRAGDMLPAYYSDSWDDLRRIMDAPGEPATAVSDPAPSELTELGEKCGDDSSADRGPWIQTFTGRRFYAADPRPAEIDIADIAHALSWVVRFTGHTRTGYSVAEHSVRVSRLLAAESPLIRLEALLHDATEAYLADVSRPFKGLPELAGYRALEARIDRVIRERFGLPATMTPAVKRADFVALATEARDLMPTSVADWSLPEAPHADRISEPWAAVRAEEEFRLEFAALIAAGTVALIKAEAADSDQSATRPVSYKNGQWVQVVEQRAGDTFAVGSIVQVADSWPTACALSRDRRSDEGVRSNRIAPIPPDLLASWGDTIPRMMPAACDPDPDPATDPGGDPGSEPVDPVIPDLAPPPPLGVGRLAVIVRAYTDLDRLPVGAVVVVEDLAEPSDLVGVRREDEVDFFPPACLAPVPLEVAAAWGDAVPATLPDWPVEWVEVNGPSTAADARPCAEDRADEATPALAYDRVGLTAAEMADRKPWECPHPADDYPFNWFRVDHAALLALDCSLLPSAVFDRLSGIYGHISRAYRTSHDAMTDFHAALATFVEPAPPLA